MSDGFINTDIFRPCPQCEGPASSFTVCQRKKLIQFFQHSYQQNEIIIKEVEKRGLYVEGKKE